MIIRDYKFIFKITPNIQKFDLRTIIFRKLTLFLLFVLIFLSVKIYGQSSQTLSGYVKDSISNEDLIGATIYIPQIERGTTCNQNGFFSINVPTTQFTVQVSYIGYKTLIINTINTNIINIIYLVPIENVISEIEIIGKKDTNFIYNMRSGSIDIDPLKLQNIPSLAGEKDLLKILQLMPGIKSGGEGNAGIYARGGTSDQNLILLDNEAVYNPTHLFGFFSIFNSDLVKNVELQKSGFKARNGGKLSSIIGISLKDGNNNQFKGKVSLGLIASKFLVEIPVQKNKSSLMIAARRTYVDLITKPFNNTGNDYFFYDLNSKYSWTINNKDRLFLNGYFGRDVFKFKQPSGTFRFDLDWGNYTGSVRWNHIFSNQLFSTQSFGITEYKSVIYANPSNSGFHLVNGIRDFTWKYDFEHYLNSTNILRYGALYTYHVFIPGETDFGDDSFFEFSGQRRKYSHDGNIYGEDEINITHNLLINCGLHYVYYKQQFNTFQKVEPRVVSRIVLGNKSNIKLNYTRMNQFIHQISTTTTTFPSEVWFSSNKNIQPQKADQFGISSSRVIKIGKRDYENTLELYFKDMKNLIELKEGAQVFINPTLENELVFGKGKAYGIEYLFQKKEGRLSGWIGYTLSWSKRQFEQLNQGIEFPSRFDRRHDVSMVLTWKLNEKWSFSSVFVYYSGNSVTLPSGRFIIDNTVYYDYTKRNSVQMPPYHRLDIGAVYVKNRKRFTSEWNFTIFNVYNRLNPFFVHFEERYSNDKKIFSQPIQVSLFPIVPSISYSLSF